MFDRVTSYGFNYVCVDSTTNLKITLTTAKVSNFVRFWHICQNLTKVTFNNNK